MDPTHNIAADARPPVRRVTDSLPCRTCGYDLKGLDVAAICPECAAPIANSLHGNLLRYTSQDFVKTLHKGALIEETALLLSAASTIALWCVMSATDGSGALASTAHKLSPIIDVALSILSLVGLWFMTTPETGATDPKADRLRRARISSAVLVAATTATFILRLYGIDLTWKRSILGGMVTFPVDAIGLTVIAALIVRFFTLLNYIAMIAKRVPDMTLHEKVRQFRWTCPFLLFPGVLICFLGPPLAFLIYVGLLDRTCRALKGVLQEM